MTTAQKMQVQVKWIDGSKGEKYALLVNKMTGCAVDCSCGDRVYRGRKSGRACKHMQAHNTATNAVAVQPTPVAEPVPAPILTRADEVSRFNEWQEELANVKEESPAYTVEDWKVMLARHKAWSDEQKKKDLERLAEVKAQAGKAA
jgi:hypothetical protein